MEHAHALACDDLTRRLHVAAADGLTEQEVVRRRLQHGPNTIASRRAANVASVLLHQFLSPVVFLLGAAAALAVAFDEHREAAAIVVVLAINALIGFATELKAARSMEALRELGSRSARVRREGHVRLIPAEDLVPGDVVLLDAGDTVPADLRLLEISRLAADESTLTGESVPVEKQVQAVSAAARLQERASMLFRGTAIARGSGVGVVVATGLDTELGRVTQLVEAADPGSSPLERKLARLSTQLVWATICLAAVFGAIGALGDEPRIAVAAAISLAVAAIPEGLPIVATLVLARGMWRMARQNALVERLSAVETLGATTVILTDKTGTLTENRMTVRRLWTASGEVDMVDVREPRRHSEHRRPQADAQVAELLRVAVLCNDASLEKASDAGSGDPMEVALLRAGMNAGLERSALLRGHRTVRKHAFDAATKMMATVHESAEGFLFAVKGAPEAVLAASVLARGEHGELAELALDAGARAEWLARAARLAQHGLRVIACAMKTDRTRGDAAPDDGLVFLGLIGMDDPARADVAQAIGDCHRAGIRVVMVTGDHAATARSVAKAVGLVREGDGDGIVEGRKIEETIAHGAQALRRASIFARVSPAEKLALVRACQAMGDVVAMTGDGVNDAPALRQADIGVAMGLRGTEVAREAAAMVLLDDAFLTIVRAIREGRVIFANIRRFAMYLLSCNLSEVTTVGLAMVLALPLPLLPLQILYLNLVTDVFPAFALAMGEGDARVLERPPRDPKEPLIGARQWVTVVLQGLTLAAGTFAALAAMHFAGASRAESVTVTFLTLALAQLWHVFDMRQARSGLFVNEVTRNPWVWAAVVSCALLVIAPPYFPGAASLLHLVPPDARMWAIVIACSTGPVILIQAAMLVAARLRRPR
ncbi:MAG TPA: cation-transporting P-type ATPase [Ramlibacter sp.]|uniref:cation-translocating P-type ATPase n=1 Tax=Ramlibacter sp. TaxID=1917967 RepID=UPI002BD1399A|nr:cation-transporting P-type ATPase [Ramlibacter sp.]HVZ45608.1 cation-transporting P-type ATPase [Ramlibacter sp.]